SLLSAQTPALLRIVETSCRSVSSDAPKRSYRESRSSFTGLSVESEFDLNGERGRPVKLRRMKLSSPGAGGSLRSLINSATRPSIHCPASALFRLAELGSPGSKYLSAGGFALESYVGTATCS